MVFFADVGFYKDLGGDSQFFFGPIEVMDAMCVYLSCSPMVNVFPDLFRVGFGRGDLRAVDVFLLRYFFFVLTGCECR